MVRGEKRIMEKAPSAPIDEAKSANSATALPARFGQDVMPVQRSDSQRRRTVLRDPAQNEAFGKVTKSHQFAANPPFCAAQQGLKFILSKCGIITLDQLRNIHTVMGIATNAANEVLKQIVE